VRAAAVGAFVIAGILLFGAGLFLIGDRRMLFSDTFEMYAEFNNIAGLQDGAKVRVAGMDAGEVESIHVPPGPSAPFRVKLRVREDLHPLIRIDSVATIQTDGLVGNRFVQVDAGTEQAQVVPPGGTVRSREPFDLSAMLQRMNETVDLVTATIQDLKNGLDEALGSVTDTAKQAQGLINELGTEATTRVRGRARWGSSSPTMRCMPAPETWSPMPRRRSRTFGKRASRPERRLRTSGARTGR
jgi:phospholipid/cholesterol/gamma-HCH transport system substrate-binding protein